MALSLTNDRAEMREVEAGASRAEMGQPAKDPLPLVRPGLVTPQPLFKQAPSLLVAWKQAPALVPK